MDNDIAKQEDLIDEFTVRVAALEAALVNLVVRMDALETENHRLREQTNELDHRTIGSMRIG